MLKITKFFTVIILVLLSVDSYSQVNGVGINTIDPKSTLDINGNLNVKEIGIFNSGVDGSGVLNGGSFSNKTQINDGVYISITPSGAENDFELPDADTVPGRIYVIRNVSTTNYAFIYSVGGDFFAKNSINPTPEPVNMTHDGVNKTLIFISDGDNWTYIF